MDAQYYMQEALWSGPPSAGQNDVADALAAMIPADVRSILDAGCGNGVVTNRLPDRYDVTGCDISHVALRHVSRPSAVADLTRLPFRDRAFDLVLSSDVIEHIPDAVYAQVVRELKRVSARYLLIAVPHEEPMSASLVRCPRCGTRYHAHLHQRVYSQHTFMADWQDEFRLVDWTLAGARWPVVEEEIAESTLRLAGLDYPFPAAICPHCHTRRGERAASPDALLLERRVAALQYLRCESGLAAWPAKCELLALLERGRGQAQPKRIGDAKLPVREARIVLDDCAVLDHLISFPEQAYTVRDTKESRVLILPCLPATMVTDAGKGVTAIEVFDAVSEHYIAASARKRRDGIEYTLPAVRPATCGYRVRVVGRGKGVQLVCRYAPESDASVLFARAFGDAGFAPVAASANDTLTKRLETVAAERDAANALANRIEAGRAKLDAALKSAKQEIADLNSVANAAEVRRAHAETLLVESRASAQGFAEALAAAEQRQAALYEQLQSCAAQRDAANALANRIEAQRTAAEQHFAKDLATTERRLTELYAQLQSCAAQRDAANALANRIEAQRTAAEQHFAQELAAAERRQAELYAQLQAVAAQRDEANALANSIEMQRVAVEKAFQEREQQQRELGSALTAALERAERLNEICNDVERRRSDTQHLLDQTLAQLQQTAVERELANELANRLEAQRAQLELALASRGGRKAGGKP